MRTRRLLALGSGPVAILAAAVLAVVVVATASTNASVSLSSATAKFGGDGHAIVTLAAEAPSGSGIGNWEFDIHYNPGDYSGDPACSPSSILTAIGDCLIKPRGADGVVRFGGSTGSATGLTGPVEFGTISFNTNLPSGFCSHMTITIIMFQDETGTDFPNPTVTNGQVCVELTTPSPTAPPETPVVALLAQDTPAGATSLNVVTGGFATRDLIVINPGGANQEYSVVNSLGSLDLAAPLQFAHSSGEEVVRVARNITAGDADCNRRLDASDAISVLRRVAGIVRYDDCVAAGNVVCTGDFNALDALDILLYVSDSDVSLPEGCPPFPVRLPETG